MIHTRVPESLDDELRKRAQELGMSVSNLVRNVLGHAFGLVGDVAADAQAIARAARGTVARRAEPLAGGDPVAWQVATLAKNALCSRCNAMLPKGSDAAIGVVDGAGPKPIVCVPCRDELTNQEAL
nr:hypothetical protein [Kofleriaceae bacterium]